MDTTLNKIKDTHAGRLRHLELHTQNNKQHNHINKNLYFMMLKPATFINAWGNIKNNKGALTPGTTQQTLQGFGLERAKAIVKRIKDNTFEPNPIRRKWIPKPGKTELRPLGIPDAEDRIVQEAIRGILEAIYEPEFEIFYSSTKGRIENFGFRPHKSTHNSIERFKILGQRTHWVIEGDIRSAYDTVNHDILMKLLERRITDKKFLNLIKSYLKAGIMEDRGITHSLIGVPQGGIVSPLLFNIYLFELDKYVHKELNGLLETLNKKQNKTKIEPNPIYRSILYKKNQLGKNLRTIKGNRPLRELLPQERKDYKETLVELRGLTSKMLETPSKSDSESTYQLVYVRYADDWILCITGPKRFAIYFRNKITSFLTTYLQLELSPSKTKITNIRTHYISFLGFNIHIKSSNLKVKRFPVTINGITRLQLKRTTSQKVQILPDKERIFFKLKSNKYVDSHNFPREKPAFSVLEDAEIVNRYNQMILGISNYYRICDSNTTIHYIDYILKYSCAKTLAQRHRITLGQVFKKYGKSLKVKYIKNEVTRFLEMKSGTKLIQNHKNTLHNKFNQFQTTFSDPFKLYSHWRTKAKPYMHCCVCGSDLRIEMHHVQSLRSSKSNSKSPFQDISDKLNRKQIPLCHKCHMDVTHGKHNHQMKLSQLHDLELAKL